MNKLEKINWQEYQKVENKFKLGDLHTEKPNPITSNLSEWANNNLPVGIKAIKDVDINAIQVLISKSEQLEDLSKAIKTTLKKGNKIFLFGCGATGRLSISLEVFCREGLVEEKYKDSFVSFMSGGDTGLIYSIEQFEDYPEYGARQLIERGFQDGDLLISTTEGGETPIVIGATEKAADLSKNKPYFLYCNPDDILKKKVERSKRVIENPDIIKISLPTGPQALSGSTRMQASTVLMAAVGFAIQRCTSSTTINKMATELLESYSHTPIDFIAKFTEQEYQTYKDQNFVIYSTNDYGVSVLTDTTERSPTFSIIPFENIKDEKNTHNALCYLSVPHTTTPLEAWTKLLKRAPLPLEWEKFVDVTGMKRLLGFDISENICSWREEKIKPRKQKYFSINKEGDDMLFQFEDKEHRLPIKGKNVLYQNLILKMILNIHSTLLMGKMGRFELNVMTWVKPTNNKLIDRSIRYINEILKTRHKLTLEYNTIGSNLAKVSEIIGEEDSIVLETVNYILNSTASKNV